MRGLLHTGNGRLEVREFPEPQPGAAGALLRVQGSAACIADAETLHGYGPVMKTPLVLGHEIVGFVADVGEQANPQLKALNGRRVLIDDARPCGRCDWCRIGQKRFCKSPRYGHIVHFPDHQNWGGYADAVTLDERSVLVPVPETLSLELATFAFPVASAVEWLILDSHTTTGEKVAVLGTSRMAVASVLVALHIGASQITLYGDEAGTDAIRAAEALGAKFAGSPLNTESKTGFDVVVVVTEAPSEYVAAAVELAAPRGRVVVASTSMDPSPVKPELIRGKGLTLKGGRGASEQALRQAVEIVATEQERLRNVVGEVYGFESAERVIKGLVQDRVVRGAHVVIAPDRSSWKDEEHT